MVDKSSIKARLLADVYSCKRVRYAVKGEVVTIISDHDPAVIVEDEKGNRFTTKKGNIQELNIKK